jgi:hypothetical protein
MFLFGHIGIALGIMYLLVRFFSSYQKPRGRPFIEQLDFRVILIGSMIPDIVDKLLGMVIFKEEIANGRILTHSVIILGILSISIVNLAQIKVKFSHLKFYILPPFLHLFLDQLWEHPRTLFWPLLGSDYTKLDIEFGDYFTILLSEPFVYITETIGAAVIITLFIRHKLYLKANFRAYLKKGTLKM